MPALLPPSVLGIVLQSAPDLCIPGSLASLLARLPQAQVPLIVPTSQALAMKADLVKNKPSTHSFTA